ncbi:hypothetical protein N431DRAFT_77671 [Stipitochalara longipes BDJ]|nr:hypothetical protein N431DRAFT_77671 [Stipitochalara longipes BDJ]
MRGEELFVCVSRILLYAASTRKGKRKKRVYWGKGLGKRAGERGVQAPVRAAVDLETMRSQGLLWFAFHSTTPPTPREKIHVLFLPGYYYRLLPFPEPASLAFTLPCCGKKRACSCQSPSSTASTAAATFKFNFEHAASWPSGVESKKLTDFMSCNGTGTARSLHRLFHEPSFPSFLGYCRRQHGT